MTFLNGYLSEWDGDWFHHVGPEYCCIEWLEIDPMGLDREFLREVVCKVGAPFEDLERFLRVIGYKR